MAGQAVHGLGERRLQAGAQLAGEDDHAPEAAAQLMPDDLAAVFR
jgi:hypothetical protein